MQRTKTKMTDIVAPPLTTPIPVTEVPLEEVRTSEELSLTLKRMLVDDLPGFVIRAGGLEGYESNDHVAVASKIAETLSELDQGSGTTPEEKYILDPVPLRLRRGRGQGGSLHDDGYLGKQVGVHRTRLGTGRVTLANSGPVMNEIAADSDFLGYMHDRNVSEAARLLEDGLANPAIMSDTVHTADLNQGDTVVKRFTNNRGPVLHRYETTSDKRESDLLEVAPATSEK